MEMDKIVNLDKEELVQQAHQSAEQIFRLRFQMKMGQNEGLKKLRELKKDIARIKTVQRQHELGIATHAHARVNATETEAAPSGRRKRRRRSRLRPRVRRRRQPRRRRRGTPSGRRRSRAKRSRQARPR